MLNKVWYEWKSGNLILSLNVKASARNNNFTTVYENRIKLSIKDAAIDGKANKAIIKYFSKEFGTPKSSIKILKGHKSSKKRVCIENPGKLPDLPALTINKK